MPSSGGHQARGPLGIGANPLGQLLSDPLCNSQRRRKTGRLNTEEVDRAGKSMPLTALDHEVCG